jgi:hypothetical protein
MTRLCRRSGRRGPTSLNHHYAPLSGAQERADLLPQAGRGAARLTSVAGNGAAFASAGPAPSPIARRRLATSACGSAVDR